MISFVIITPNDDSMADAVQVFPLQGPCSAVDFAREAIEQIDPVLSSKAREETTIEGVCDVYEMLDRFNDLSINSPSGIATVRVTTGFSTPGALGLPCIRAFDCKTKPVNVPFADLNR
jgi:hypothetical protein